MALVERYRVAHSQLVPTMFSRMLKLPDEARRRYDVSSLEIAIHAAAPCPVPVKERMIKWWGAITLEYYAATEGHGLTACDSAEWLAHLGTVGRVLLGELHVIDEDMQPVPAGAPGTVVQDGELIRGRCHGNERHAHYELELVRALVTGISVGRERRVG